MKQILNKKVLIIFSIVLIAIIIIFTVLYKRTNIIEKVSDNHEQLTTNEKVYLPMADHLEELESAGISFDDNEEVVLIKALKANSKTGNGTQHFTGSFTPREDINKTIQPSNNMVMFIGDFKIKSIIILTVGSGSSTIGATKARDITDPEGNVYKPMILPGINPNNNNFTSTTNATIGASFYPYEFKPDVKYTLDWSINLTTGVSTNEAYGQVYVYAILDSGSSFIPIG